MDLVRYVPILSDSTVYHLITYLLHSCLLSKIVCGLKTVSQLSHLCCC